MGPAGILQRKHGASESLRNGCPKLLLLEPNLQSIPVPIRASLTPPLFSPMYVNTQCIDRLFPFGDCSILAHSFLCEQNSLQLMLPYSSVFSKMSPPCRWRLHSNGKLSFHGPPGLSVLRLPFPRVIEVHREASKVFVFRRSCYQAAGPIRT